MFTVTHPFLSSQSHHSLCNRPIILFALKCTNKACMTTWSNDDPNHHFFQNCTKHAIQHLGEVRRHLPTISFQCHNHECMCHVCQNQEPNYLHDYHITYGGHHHPIRVATPSIHIADGRPIRPWAHYGPVTHVPGGAYDDGHSLHYENVDVSKLNYPTHQPLDDYSRRRTDYPVDGSGVPEKLGIVHLWD